MSFILRKLQGANLEVFKFGMYVLFPIGWMYYFGTNLEERFSVPGFWPTKEQSHKIPESKEEIDNELARMRMLNELRRERRKREEEELRQRGLLSQGGAGESSS
ncbi:hypothetical protein VTN49DRAFT_2466 [Thermomyces lanuginosus]|uniref:uncharacterized protein n=1 Tax=Thermomyces lanuginosus TaxID=5541 RepID=UPI0037429FB1